MTPNVPATANASTLESSRLGAETNSHRGLTTAEAQRRLKRFGPDAVVEEKTHPVKAWPIFTPGWPTI